MRATRRLLATLTAALVATGGIMVATAGAATAAPVCVSDGISREVGRDGVPVFRNNTECGDVYRYDVRRTSTPKPPTVKPPATNACLSGYVGDIACGRTSDSTIRGGGGIGGSIGTIYIGSSGGSTRVGIVTVHTPQPVQDK